MGRATTAQRLREVMEKRKLRQVDVLELSQPFSDKYGVKLNKNDLSQYLSGKVQPKQDKLTLLGLTLNVSEGWLMGFDVSPDRATENAPVSGQDDGRVTECMELFSLLSDTEKDLIIRQIRGILQTKGPHPADDR